MEKQTEREVSLNDYLAMMLLQYFKRNENASLKGVFNKTGVNPRTLGKIIEKEPVRLDKMDPLKVFWLYNLVTPERDLNENDYITFFQAYRDQLDKKRVDLFIEEGLEKMLAPSSKSKSVESLLDTSVKFKIYSLVCTSYEGFTESQLIQYAGEGAIQAAEDLQRKNVFTKQNGRYSINESLSENFLWLSKKFIATNYPELAKSIDENSEENCGIQSTAIGLSQGLNSKSLQKLRKAEIEFSKVLNEVLNDEDGHGDIPYFTFLASGPYIKDMVEFRKRGNGTQEGVLQ